MTASLSFDQIRLPPECEALRQDVRAFIADEVAAGSFDPEHPGHGDQHSKELSRRIMMIVGGGSGIGREVALLAAQRGATHTTI